MAARQSSDTVDQPNGVIPGDAKATSALTGSREHAQGVSQACMS
jgi:hypothetical protein